MSEATAEALPEGAEEQLNKAIEELRGVLHEDKQAGPAGRPPLAGGADNSSIIMNIPVEVQIVLAARRCRYRNCSTCRRDRRWR